MGVVQWANGSTGMTRAALVWVSTPTDIPSLIWLKNNSPFTALPARVALGNFNKGLYAMIKRRRFKQTKSLRDRLMAWLKACVIERNSSNLDHSGRTCSRKHGGLKQGHISAIGLNLPGCCHPINP